MTLIMMVIYLTLSTHWPGEEMKSKKKKKELKNQKLEAKFFIFKF